MTIFWLFVGVVAIVVFVTFLIKRDEEINDPEVMKWLNLNNQDPDLIKFHSTDLSFVYTRSSNNLQIHSRGYDGKVLNFNGISSAIEFGNFSMRTVYQSTDTSVTSSSGQTFTIHGTGGYDRTTGLYRLDVKLKDSFADDGIAIQTFPTVTEVDRDRLKSIFSEIKLVNFKKEQELKQRAKAEQLQKEADDLEAKKKEEEDALKNVRTQYSRLLSEWNIASEGSFKTYHYRSSNGGFICTMLAADKEGRGGAVLNDGKDTWSGSWKNARVNEVGETLEIQIDDPVYREKNLKERRFVIKYFDREQRLEWIDRIRILSAQA